MRARSRRSLVAVALAVPLLLCSRPGSRPPAWVATGSRSATAAAAPHGARRPLLSALLAASAGPSASTLVAPGAAGAAAAATAEGEASGGGEAVAGSAGVVDAAGLLTSSTRSTLDTALGQLERDTGLKVRLVCPPPGLQRDREAWGEYIKPIAKSWGIDQSSIVVTAEQREQSRSGKRYSILEFSPGFRLFEKFQFRLGSEYFIRTRNRLGSPGNVDAKGADVAIQDGVQNLVACLYKLTDERGSTCQDALDPKEVSAILKRHAL